MINNQVLSSWEMARIRTLSDPRLTILILVIHKAGWPAAQKLLKATELEWPAPPCTIDSEQLVALRTLDDFDLTMIISDIHDHGWPMAAGTLNLAVEASWKAPDKKTVQ